MVTQLPEEFAKPNVLCNIFGNYGDVHRVKIMYKKPDRAIIQMAKPHQATLGCRYLDQIKLGGKRIGVYQSGIDSVKLPLEGQDDELTKDYSTARIHRFSNPKFAEHLMKKMGFPNPILHVSNVPEGKVDSLKEYFIESGFTVKDIRPCGKLRIQRTKRGWHLLSFLQPKKLFWPLVSCTIQCPILFQREGKW